MPRSLLFWGRSRLQAVQSLMPLLPGPGLLWGEPRSWDCFSPSLARVSPPWRLPLGPALPREGGGRWGREGRHPGDCGPCSELMSSAVGPAQACGCPRTGSRPSAQPRTVTALQTPCQGHRDRRLQRMPALSRQSQLAALEDGGRRKRGLRRTDGGPGLQQETGH